MVSKILFSKADPGQRFTLRFTVWSSDSRSVTKRMYVFVSCQIRSLTEFLPGHWVDFQAGRTGPGLWLIGDGIEFQCYFWVYSLD